MPPLPNFIALATFAASLSARALDPVLPHVAGDFNVSIATAASFASVFAFTFAIIQPVLSVQTRAAALSLYSFFFFMGRTVGPIAYRCGSLNAGKVSILPTSANIIVTLGFV